MMPYQIMTRSCGRQQFKCTVCEGILKLLVDAMVFFLREGGSARYRLSRKDSLQFTAILVRWGLVLFS